MSFLKFLTKIKGFWKLYSGYGYDGETIAFIIDTYEKVLCNRTKTMSKPTYYLNDILGEIDRYYEMDYEKAVQFLEKEIEISKARKKKYSPIYDGENIGVDKRDRLLNRHIHFCEHILELLE